MSSYSIRTAGAVLVCIIAHAAVFCVHLLVIAKSPGTALAGVIPSLTSVHGLNEVSALSITVYQVWLELHHLHCFSIQ